MSKNKYSAKKCTRTVAGYTYDFDSKAEAEYFDYLIRRFRAGKIKDLTLQPKYNLTDPFELKCDFTKSGVTKIGGMVYTPDFRYMIGDKTYVVEVKGMVTESYRMRLKLFLYKAFDLGINEFHEVLKGGTKIYKTRGA